SIAFSSPQPIALIRSPIVFWRQGTARPVMGRDLLKQRLKLTGGKLNFTRVLIQLALRAQLHLQKFRIPQNGGQQIVALLFLHSPVLLCRNCFLLLPLQIYSSFPYPPPFLFPCIVQKAP